MTPRKLRATALLLALLLTLSACGASSKSEAPAADYAPRENASFSYNEAMDTPASEPEIPTENSIGYDEDYISTSAADTTEVGAGSDAVNTLAEKIIYSGYVSLETTHFDDALQTLDKTIRELGGFIENSSVEGSSRTYSDGTTAVVNRWAYYTVRIPADRFEDFLARTDGIGNVTSTSRTAENVTSQYTDYEARLSSLRVQEERLLAMLEQSGDLDSLIALEARLSEVRYEIESIERNLRNLDQRLSYSTVNLTIQEVAVYTPTVTVTRSFGQKLADAFGDGWSGFVYGLQDFCLFLAESLPTLVLLAVIIVALVLVIRALRRRRAARRAQRAQPAADETPATDEPEQK